jgi:hypothetical protein
MRRSSVLVMEQIDPPYNVNGDRNERSMIFKGAPRDNRRSLYPAAVRCYVSSVLREIERCSTTGTSINISTILIFTKGPLFRLP